jgi:hypothetical protein
MRAGVRAAGRCPPLPGNQRRLDRRHAPYHGDQQPAAERDRVGDRGHRRLGARHQRAADAAGVEETQDDIAVRITSNRP